MRTSNCGNYVVVPSYQSYRVWWDSYGRSCGNYEKTFEEHINEMTLYELMEKLEFWDTGQ